MSYRIAVLALASGCLVFGQKNQGSADRIDLKEQPIVENTDSRVVGNEKTVGGSNRATNVRRSEDSNSVGNAKTVGGAASYAVAQVVDSEQRVGNSKTVGGR